MLAERTGDQTDISSVLAMLGEIALAAGNEEQAANYFTESYTAAKQAGVPVALGLALLNRGDLARKRGDVAGATEFLEEALVYVRAIDMTWGTRQELDGAVSSDDIASLVAFQGKIGVLWSDQGDEAAARGPPHGRNAVHRVPPTAARIAHEAIQARDPP